MQEAGFGGHSLTGPLRRVLVCSPRAAGWNRPAPHERWRELGYFHAPVADVAQDQHDALCRILRDCGAEVLELPPDDALSLDAVYAHDASFPTDAGAILMRMGKEARRGEPGRHRAHYQDLGLPVLGEIEAPGMVEAGDLVWLGPQRLLIGRTYRTNDHGIQQMRELLQPLGVEVLVSSLPYGQGPDFCLHLMSLMSMLDRQTILVDRSWLAVDTVELLAEMEFDLIDIDITERDTLACNVVALGHRRVVTLDENPSTVARMREHGLEVFTFPGSELCINGSGGPTCLTRPLWRADE